MVYALSWLAVLILLAIWSLGTWACLAIGTWTVATTGVLASSSPAIALRLPDWLAAWIPPEIGFAFTSMLSTFGPTIQAIVDRVPDLTGSLSAAIWLIWAVGCALLSGMGIVVSGAIALLRRRSPHTATQRVG